MESTFTRTVGFILTSFSTVALGQVSQSTPIEVRIPAPPVPARFGDRKMLAYELHITNFSAREVTLKRIKVFDPKPLSIMTSRRCCLLFFDWHAGLHAPMTNGPITYELDGSQYVVIGAEDTLYAFTIR